jgi:hypothetical protein
MAIFVVIITIQDKITIIASVKHPKQETFYEFLGLQYTALSALHHHHHPGLAG